MWKDIGNKVAKYEILIVILAGVVVLRIPSLFEPYWYGDEGIYLTIGQALNRGETLYKDIHDNKPPFLYLAAAVAGGNQFWFKALAGGWNLATVVAFWWLAGKVWGENKRAAVVGTAVFALLTTLPKLEGNIANAELFFLLPAILAMGVLWQAKSTGEVFWGGVLLGLGGLFKVPVILEAGVWPVVWFLRQEKKWFSNSFCLAAGVALPLVLSAAYFSGIGAGTEYWTAAWAQNIPYLSTWKAATNNEAGTLKGRAAVLGILMLGIAVVRKRIDRRGMILGLWFLFGLFAALLSGRPYPHYLMQMAGAMALGITLIIWGSKKEKGLVAILAIVLGSAVWTYKFWGYPVIGYYENFSKWVVGQETQSQYYNWFGLSVNRDYEIAARIMAGSDKGDKLFVWGDDASLYALTQRTPADKYIAAYHVLTFGTQVETINKLRYTLPKYIVVTTDPTGLPGLVELLNQKYALEKKWTNASLYRRSINLSEALLGIIAPWKGSVKD